MQCSTCGKRATFEVKEPDGDELRLACGNHIAAAVRELGWGLVMEIAKDAKSGAKYNEV